MRSPRTKLHYGLIRVHTRAYAGRAAVRAHPQQQPVSQYSRQPGSGPGKVPGAPQLLASFCLQNTACWLDCRAGWLQSCAWFQPAIAGRATARVIQVVWAISRRVIEGAAIPKDKRGGCTLPVPYSGGGAWWGNLLLLSQRIGRQRCLTFARSKAVG
jgi:hypothetical protein